MKQKICYLIALFVAFSFCSCLDENQKYIESFYDQLDMKTDASNFVMAHKGDGIRLFNNPVDQQFVILDNAKLEELRPKVGFSFWERYDDTHTVVRFATSWATLESDLDKLEKLL